ncbi:hypothetical protein GC722_16425 [Auraticoccus sp. F435]|uniref:Uncharacterized protein n=1 Tax=Auraticoccus cholistanensis TaxID=2656650 RepID=A0A6A9V268_9ACTN|nr:hypothetical protein [Auraticoccus cholistanensis]MVA77591.1 hypothetical protein [Auraticoccus cholistanensis]
MWSSVLLLVAVAVVGWFVLTAWSTGRAAARDRDRLVAAAVEAWLVLLWVRAAVPLPGVLSWCWVGAVAATAVGVAGAARRWGGLPWRAGPRGRPDQPVPGWRRRLAVAGVALSLALGVAATVVLA